MNKKLFVVIALLISSTCAALAYLAALELPLRARAFIAEEIERASGKKIFFRSAYLSPLKGLVLDKPVLYDGASVIIRARQISCGMSVPSIFRRRIVVPAIRIDAPALALERRPDGSLNIAELFTAGYAPKTGMTQMFHRIVINNGAVHFIDRTVEPAVSKRLSRLNADIRLYLPVRILFTAEAEVRSSVTTAFKAAGEYVIPLRSFTCRLEADDLAPNEFAPYYNKTGIVFGRGTLDGAVTVRMKDGILDVEAGADTKALEVSKDALRATLSSGIKVSLKHGDAGKPLSYSGTLDIRSMDLSGIDGAGKVEHIQGAVQFNDTKLSSEGLRAEVFGMPWNLKVNLVNYTRPIFDLYADADTHLSALQKLFKERFGMSLPVELAGASHVSLALQSEPGKPLKTAGTLRFSDGTMNLGKGNYPIERMEGQARFTPEKIVWSGIGFTYRGTRYSSSGSLEDLSAPRVRLKVRSDILSLASVFSVDGKRIAIKFLKGRYFNSAFSGSGELDFGDPGSVDSALEGDVQLDLNDLKQMMKSSGAIRKMRPSGTLGVHVAMSGDLRNPKGCFIDAKVKGPRLVLYGTAFEDALLEYVQEEGAGKLRSMRASVYGGTMSAIGTIDWLSKGFPYSMNVDVRDVKIERLKADTGFKNEDVSGTIKVIAKMSGVFRDISRFSAIGHIGVENGKLWQLNLFKGMGSLIFTRDFKNIVFTGGGCDFKVKERTFFADYIVLKSELVNMVGSGRIGFDRSVDGAFRTELTDEAMDYGTQRNIAEAVGQYSYIEVSGTLSDPKFTMKSNMPAMLAGIAGAFLQGPQE